MDGDEQIRQRLQNAAAPAGAVDVVKEAAVIYGRCSDVLEINGLLCNFSIDAVSRCRSVTGTRGPRGQRILEQRGQQLAPSRNVFNLSF